MATILVSLVSEQTIPNVLYIRECNNVDGYVFISTEKMDKKNVSQHIMEASGTVSNENSETVIVKEDSLQDIEKELKKQPFNKEDKFLVNLTDGTKIMAIGVYDFSKNLEWWWRKLMGRPSQSARFLLMTILQRKVNSDWGFALGFLYLGSLKQCRRRPKKQFIRSWIFSGILKENTPAS